MSETPDDIIEIALARLALLNQLVRLLLRERAAQNNQSSEDILKWSEEMKQFFEIKTSGTSEARLTGAIDDFMNLLASEVRADRESH